MPDATLRWPGAAILLALTLSPMLYHPRPALAAAPTGALATAVILTAASMKPRPDSLRLSRDAATLLVRHSRRPDQVVLSIGLPARRSRVNLILYEVERH